MHNKENKNYNSFKYSTKAVIILTIFLFIIYLINYLTDFQYYNFLNYFNYISIILILIIVTKFKNHFMNDFITYSKVFRLFIIISIIGNLLYLFLLYLSLKHFDYKTL